MAARQKLYGCFLFVEMHHDWSRLLWFCSLLLVHLSKAVDAYFPNLLKMPVLFSNKGYADVNYIYEFCDGNARAACKEYRRRFPRINVC